MNNSSNFESQKALPPALVETGVEVRYEGCLPPKNVIDILQYFTNKYREVGDENYANYAGSPVVRLRNALEDVYINVRDRKTEPVTVPLLLRPSLPYEQRWEDDSVQHKAQVVQINAGERLFSYTDIPPATTALMELTYSMTQAEILADDRDVVGEGRVLLRGNYHDRPVHFIERYGSDNLGDYMTWEATDSPPEELMPSPAQHPYDRPFLTTNEEQELILDVYKDLRRIPTKSIDESQVIRSWISRRAA